MATNFFYNKMKQKFSITILIKIYLLKDSYNGIQILIQANPSIHPHTSHNLKVAMKTVWTNLGTTFVVISSNMIRDFAVLMATLSADKSTTSVPMNLSTMAWSFSPVRSKPAAADRSHSSRWPPLAPPKLSNPVASQKAKCATIGLRHFRALIRAISSMSNSHRWARFKPLSVWKQALMMKMSHVEWRGATFWSCGTQWRCISASCLRTKTPSFLWMRSTRRR